MLFLYLTEERSRRLIHLKHLGFHFFNIMLLNLVVVQERNRLKNILKHLRKECLGNVSVCFCLTFFRSFIGENRTNRSNSWSQSIGFLESYWTCLVLQVFSLGIWKDLTTLSTKNYGGKILCEKLYLAIMRTVCVNVTGKWSKDSFVSPILASSCTFSCLYDLVGSITNWPWMYY